MKPNFFILGAPKCGTTSLANWLSRHHHIFMSSVKEPHFFNTDDRRGVTTLREYEGLFCDATVSHRAIGEASVWYLSSRDAVSNILDYQPEARFVVMLRNPVEMAPAVHAEMLLAGHENVSDFATAWNLQNERRAGHSIPPFTWSRRRLLYGDICSLGAQLERLLALVPKERVVPVLLDDVSSDPGREYRRILQCLGLVDDGRCEFHVYNKARSSRSPRLTRALFVATQIKRRMGIRLGMNLSERLSKINVFETPRKSLPPQTLLLLREYFANDVELLGRLLGRNLGAWVTASGPVARAGKRLSPEMPSTDDHYRIEEGEPSPPS